MQNVVHVLKNWYPTSVVPEPEFRAREAVHRRIEEHVAELAQIVQKANKNGVYLKAPNGKPTNLTEHQWALVRTKAFKQEFGDWERAAQVAKLLKSDPIVASGNEWRGKYELNRDAAKKYIEGSLRRKYVNRDTGSTIEVTLKSRKSANYDRDIKKLVVVALIPEMIKRSVFLDEGAKEGERSDFDRFRYYAVLVKIGSTDYVVRITTGVDKNGEKYYDHMVTEIKKEEPTGQRDWLEALVYDRWSPPSGIEDTRLLSLLQGDFSTFPNLVDENGEPKVAEVEAFESKHADIQLQQLTWIKQDGKAFGWFNPATNTIVLCEGHSISTALEAFWHATFYSTKANTPVLHARMSAFARRKVPRKIRGVLEKFYPELEAGSAVWFEKLGALLFVMDYADKIENSLNNEKSFFDNVLRVFSGDRVNLVGIGRRPPEKAVAALAHAFASGKHPTI